VNSRVLSADWIVPVTTPPIRHGQLVIDNHRIVWLGPSDKLPERWRSAPVEHLAGVLTPGLVNAHTHLQ
jgi:cytosine/adenosine deaminase-related metal-dependent hydrolase